MFKSILADKSFTHIRNKRGEGQAPCGTPEDIFDVREAESLHVVNCRQHVRKSRTHAMTSGSMHRDQCLARRR